MNGGKFTVNVKIAAPSYASSDLKMIPPDPFHEQIDGVNRVKYWNYARTKNSSADFKFTDAAKKRGQLPHSNAVDVFFRPS